MVRKDLKNKPLVEALLELKWVLPVELQKGLSSDPNYRILLGRFSERVKEKYPFYEPLPTSSMPDEMVAHMVQHRFRLKEGGWPVVQLGPGVLTVNDTDGYTWTDFQSRCERAIRDFVESYPIKTGPKYDALTLRYIDAIPFDYATDDIFDFLKSKMKTVLALPATLFEGNKVSPKPNAFKWEVSFSNANPNGTVIVRFGSASKEGVPALSWETLVVSKGSEIPALPDKFPSWLNLAHDLTDDWFFKLIEGELEKRFSGE